ncbi:helix-turn-helix domain-containing protein [Micromonosporaceae bacterium DT194]|uniref:helix-turn-helix domain-containing protein n=1 Tax=Melissospora conviva TaxID=3388432 RepID=UPI003C1A7783
MAIELTDPQREDLRALARRATARARDVLRARIVLAAADGMANTTIAGRLGVHVDTVRTWRRRFVQHGPAGLADRPRSDRPCRYGPAARLKVVATVTGQVPQPDSQWTHRGPCQDRDVLRSVEVTTVLVLPSSSHNLHWRGRLELSLDCFICQRTGRTTTFVVGADRAVCSGDDKFDQHYSAGRIAAFDHREERDQTSLRAVVDYWWAPFHDAKRNEPGVALTRAPWVRLHLGYYCPKTEKPGEFHTQTNLVRPSSGSCRHCSAPVMVSQEVPQLRLLVGR